MRKERNVGGKGKTEGRRLGVGGKTYVKLNGNKKENESK